MKAHPVVGSGGKAKDPIFGLAMGVSSQAPPDVFRYFEIMLRRILLGMFFLNVIILVVLDLWYAEIEIGLFAGFTD